MPAYAFIKRMAELIRCNPKKSILAALCLFFGGFYLTFSPDPVRSIVYLEPVGLSRDVADGHTVKGWEASPYTDDRFAAITMLANGNIAICFGSDYIYDRGKAYPAVVRPDGKVLWQQELPDNAGDVVIHNSCRLAAMPDGGILIYSTFGWVRKYNETGELLWRWEADKKTEASLYAALPLPVSKADGFFLPGGVLVGGAKIMTEESAKQPWLFVLDAAGKFAGEFALQRPEPLAPDTAIGHWDAAPLDEPPGSVQMVDGFTKVALRKTNTFDPPPYPARRDMQINALAYDAGAITGGKPCVLAAVSYSERSYSSDGKTMFTPDFSWLLQLDPSGSQTDIAYFPNTVIKTIGTANGTRFLFGTTRRGELETYLALWPVGETSPASLPRPFLLHLTKWQFAWKALITSNGSVVAVFSFPYSLNRMIPPGTVVVLYGPDGKIEIKHPRFRDIEEVAGVLAVGPDGDVLVGGQERIESGQGRLWLGKLSVP